MPTRLILCQLNYLSDPMMYTILIKIYLIVRVFMPVCCEHRWVHAYVWLEARRIHWVFFEVTYPTITFGEVSP